MALRGNRRTDGLVALHGGGGLGLLHRGSAEGEGAADGGIVLLGLHQHSFQRRVVLRVGGSAQSVLSPLVLHERLRAAAAQRSIAHVYIYHHGSLAWRRHRARAPGRPRA